MSSFLACSCNSVCRRSGCSWSHLCGLLFLSFQMPVPPLPIASLPSLPPPSLPSSSFLCSPLHFQNEDGWDPLPPTCPHGPGRALGLPQCRGLNSQAPYFRGQGGLCVGPSWPPVLGRPPAAPPPSFSKTSVLCLLPSMGPGSFPGLRLVSGRQPCLHWSLPLGRPGAVRTEWSLCPPTQVSGPPWCPGSVWGKFCQPRALSGSPLPPGLVCVQVSAYH